MYKIAGFYMFEKCCIIPLLGGARGGLYYSPPWRGKGWVSWVRDCSGKPTAAHDFNMEGKLECGEDL